MEVKIVEEVFMMFIRIRLIDCPQIFQIIGEIYLNMGKGKTLGLIEEVEVKFPAVNQETRELVVDSTILQMS